MHLLKANATRDAQATQLYRERVHISRTYEFDSCRISSSGQVNGAKELAADRPGVPREGVKIDVCSSSRRLGGPWGAADDLVMVVRRDDGPDLDFGYVAFGFEVVRSRAAFWRGCQITAQTSAPKGGMGNCMIIIVESCGDTRIVLTLRNTLA